MIVKTLGDKVIEFKTVKYFDCHDLMKYVKENYGKEIDVIRPHAEYSGQDTFVEIDVNAEMPDEGWWPEDEAMYDSPDLALQRWVDGDDSINANENLILWDMCRKGLIAPGEYVMKVWW